VDAGVCAGARWRPVAGCAPDLSNAWVASWRVERLVVVTRRLMGSSDGQHAGEAPAEATLGRSARSALTLDIRGRDGGGFLSVGARRQGVASAAARHAAAGMLECVININDLKPLFVMRPGPGARVSAAISVGQWRRFRGDSGAFRRHAAGLEEPLARRASIHAGGTVRAY